VVLTPSKEYGLKGKSRLRALRNQTAGHRTAELKRTEESNVQPQPSRLVT
jgi:hypothetical protein